MALSNASLSVAVNATQTNALDLTTGTFPTTVRKVMNLTAGTGAGKGDKMWSDRRTLIASATEDLDLAGVLLDVAGAAITFARIKGLYISADAANTNNVVIGAGTAPWIGLLGATHTITLRPGAFVGFGTGSADAVGYAVTPTTADILKIANSAAGTPVSYDVVIIGVSA